MTPLNGREAGHSDVGGRLTGSGAGSPVPGGSRTCQRAAGVPLTLLWAQVAGDRVVGRPRGGWRPDGVASLPVETSGAGVGEFGNLQQWSRQSRNAAQPRGMRQAGQAAQSYERAGGNGEFSNLAQFTSQRGYVGNAQSWYTGANQAGVENGWDTSFWKRAMEQQERLAEQGRLGEQFETKHATGVVTWDHTSKDGNQEFHFGDVYDDGRMTGNVFKQFDKPTADLMMADILFDADTKAHLFSENDPRKALREAVHDKRRENNEKIPQREAVLEFQGNVAERAKEFEEGGVDTALVIGGVAGGAALGAGVGSVVPVLGTTVGGVVGGLLGGAGAFMNQDALTEQAARAYEITKMSDTPISTGIQQWSQILGKEIVPFSNLTQGAYDAAEGKIGDGKSEFYAVNKEGDRKTPKWVQVADVAATIADSALQFATPIGVGLYTTQMSGVIGGEVGELALSGKSFDYSRGGFDSVFTDDDGNFDGLSAMAGIGKVGIDAVQLGMVRGLAGKVDSVRLAAGSEAAFGRLGTKIPMLGDRVAAARAGVAERVTNRLPFLGRTTEQRVALEQGGRVDEAAGFKRVLD